MIKIVFPALLGSYNRRTERPTDRAGHREVGYTSNKGIGIYVLWNLCSKIDYLHTMIIPL